MLARYSPVLPLVLLMALPGVVSAQTNGNSGVRDAVGTMDNMPYSAGDIGAKIGEMFGSGAKADWDEAMTHTDLVNLEFGTVGEGGGRSDGNTILIDMDNVTLAECALIGLHEATHSNSAADANGANDGEDPNTKGQCGACNHATQHMSELAMVAAADCENQATGGLAELCEMHQKTRNRIEDLITECKDAGCPTASGMSSNSVPPMCSCPHS